MKDLDKSAIDALTGAFFDAFTTRGAAELRIDTLYGLFLPDAVIIKNVDAIPTIYDVAGFIEPRRTLLTGGSIVDFSEAEVSEETAIFQNVAQRFSRYTKTWREAGVAFSGRGVKTVQYVRTAGGWRISALAWDDEPATRIDEGVSR